jgi:hypothetical protein
MGSAGRTTRHDPPQRDRGPQDDRGRGTGRALSIDRRAWWFVAGLWIAAFLARGPLYLSVFPPFEGWDEYQHLAYIVHLDETGTIPAYDSRVPQSLRPLVLGLPHSAPGHDQLNEWGVLSYADYWDAPRGGSTGQAVSSSPRLYQSQQPPLAYVLALPIWRAFKTSHPRDAIFAIRAINLLLVAAALLLFARALERLVPAFGPRAAVLALVCLHPLFFQNVARVANDGLALATGMAGLSLLLMADGRTLLARGLLAAVCLAASNWSKQTSLTLIPALVLGLPLIGWAHGAPARQLWRATGLSVGAFVLLVAPLWLWSYQQYGVLLMTQDSLELAARGPVAGALATSFTTMAWGPVVGSLFFPGWPWVGGWSFLPGHATLTNLYEWYWGILLAAAGAAAAFVMVRRARSLERTDAARLTVCAAVVIGMMLGMTYHAVLSNAVVGHATTTPWYFMTALPFLFVLVVRGLAAINPRLAIACAAGLAALFVAIELYGTWVQMPAAYANTTDPALQWRRLTTIHPAMLSGRLRWWFLATQFGALCLAAGGMVMAARARARSNISAA